MQILLVYLLELRHQPGDLLVVERAPKQVRPPHPDSFGERITEIPDQQSLRLLPRFGIAQGISPAPLTLSQVRLRVGLTEIEFAVQIRRFRQTLGVVGAPHVLVVVSVGAANEIDVWRTQNASQSQLSGFVRAEVREIQPERPIEATDDLPATGDLLHPAGVLEQHVADGIVEVHEEIRNLAAYRRIEEDPLRRREPGHLVRRFGGLERHARVSPCVAQRIDFIAVFFPQPGTKGFDRGGTVVFHAELRRVGPITVNLPERVERQPFAAETVPDLVPDDGATVFVLQVRDERVHQPVRKLAIGFRGERRMGTTPEHPCRTPVVALRDLIGVHLPEPVSGRQQDSRKKQGLGIDRSILVQLLVDPAEVPFLGARPGKAQVEVEDPDATFAKRIEVPRPLTIGRGQDEALLFSVDEQGRLTPDDPDLARQTPSRTTGSQHQQQNKSRQHRLDFHDPSSMHVPGASPESNATCRTSALRLYMHFRHGTQGGRQAEIVHV